VTPGRDGGAPITCRGAIQYGLQENWVGAFRMKCDQTAKTHWNDRWRARAWRRTRMTLPRPFCTSSESPRHPVLMG
jgi:hypothetical protein